MLQTALFLGSQTSFHGITYLIKYKILSWNLKIKKTVHKKIFAWWEPYYEVVVPVLAFFVVGWFSIYLCGYVELRFNMDLM